MRVSISAFQRAIEQWHESLAVLRGAAVCRREDGEIIFTNTKHFVDCYFSDSEQRYMLSMALSSDAMLWAKSAAVQLRTLSSPWLCRYEVLADALRVKSVSAMVDVDLVCHYLPSGKPLSEVAGSVGAEVLYGAVAQLYDELERLEVMHSNLHADNIIFTDEGRLVPLRYHYLAKFNPYEAQNDFDRLLSWIERKTGVPRPIEICQSAPQYAAPVADLADYEWCSNYLEGLCLVRREGLYGYVDMDGVEVIAPQFIWANDMHEGRAEVTLQSGMGLINGKGRYIIEPQYEVVDYDMSTNCVQVRQDGLWARFDYNGVQQTEFAALEEVTI